jgi:D-tyrosyl-tRNA(Tyr) deacylase
MKIILQRVNHASVSVDDETVGSINQGVLLLIGFGSEEDQSKLGKIAEKISQLRIFPDERGRFHYSLLDIKGSVLLVPQFTLFADTSKGRRPEFFGALDPKIAKKLFEDTPQYFIKAGIDNVQTGRFGAYMQVSLENDGPVTIPLEF